MEKNDYIVFTIHDNDFGNYFRTVAVLFSHLITQEEILDNKNLNIEIIKDFFLDMLLKNYEILNYSKNNDESSEHLSKYFKEHLKVYFVSKENVVYDNGELLYICINEKMREFGEFFII